MNTYCEKSYTWGRYVVWVIGIIYISSCKLFIASDPMSLSGRILVIHRLILCLSDTVIPRNWLEENPE